MNLYIRLLYNIIYLNMHIDMLISEDNFNTWKFFILIIKYNN